MVSHKERKQHHSKSTLLCWIVLYNIKNQPLSSSLNRSPHERTTIKTTFYLITYLCWQFLLSDCPFMLKVFTDVLVCDHFCMVSSLAGRLITTLQHVIKTFLFISYIMTNMDPTDIISSNIGKLTMSCTY